MKHLINSCIGSLLLSVVGISFTSCDNNGMFENEDVVEYEAELRADDHNGKYKIEDWSGDPITNCAWNGFNCMVIIADAPERVMADNNDWAQLFDDGDQTYGLDEDLVEGIFTGQTTVSKKERGADLQVRLQ